MAISIVYVMSNLDVGGAECHIAQIVPKLDRTLVQPTIFTIINKGILAKKLEVNKVPVVGPDEECDWHQLNKLQRLLCLIRGAVHLFLFLRRQRPDVVHFFLPMPYLIGGVVTVLSGIRGRVMSRRSLNIYQDRYPGIALFERWLHRRMSRVLGNSQAVLSDLRKEGVPENKLRLTYNGVDLPVPLSPQKRYELRRQLNVGSNDPLITIVANLIPYKGHDDLLHALAGVSMKLPRNWKLVCIGYDSHKIKNELLALSEELKIAQNVQFIGGRNDVPDLLQASDVSVLSSHQEGFSNAVLEGMAAGLPMIVTDVGGNGEAVRDGIDGYVVPAHSPDVLGQAITRLLNDTELRESMGSSARARAEAQFSIQACVNNYECIYSEIVSQ